jgi:membrane peptidoglycan carboxypeptidase
MRRFTDPRLPTRPGPPGPSPSPPAPHRPRGAVLPPGVRRQRRSTLTGLPPRVPVEHRVRRQRASASNGRVRRQRTPQMRALRVALIILAIVCGCGLAGVAAVYAAYQGYKSGLPDAQTLAGMEPPLDSRVVDQNGTLIGLLHDNGNRHQHVAVDQVSRWVKLATVDVEDRHFYENGSWDLPRIVKAGWDDVRHTGATQGASTITEQLAKISFLSPERSLDRKVKELILGIEIENNFSKNQILEMYLNRVSFGNHAIGIESAAQTYFEKKSRDLDLAEASMLAGLPNSPVFLNPLDHPPGQTVNPNAKARQLVVLQAMVNNGDITQQQADFAYQQPLVFHEAGESEPPVTNFIVYLRSWLDQKFGDQYIKPGGWTITATLDPKRQAIAEKSVHDGIQKIYDRFNAHDGALVSMDPRNGAVVAMVGAWDPNNSGVGQLNMATRPLQPGSTIKVFTYSTAIATRKFTMTTPVVDGPVRLDDGSNSGYSPKNYDHSYHGVCPLMRCLGNSYNIPAVKVEAAVGIPTITDLEIAAGLTSLKDPKNRPKPNQFAATLGGLTYGVSPLEMATGISTIADMGVHHEATPVLRVTDAGGKVLYALDAKDQGHRVIPANVAFIISEITSNDSNRYAAFGPHGDLTLPDRRVSAKTGTTEFFSANWTLGWTPTLVNVVWVGNPSGSCLKPSDRNNPTVRARLGSSLDDPLSPADLSHYGLTPKDDHCGHLEGSTGITGAAPIWHSYMSQALADSPKDWYPRPNDVTATGPGDDAVFYLPGTTGPPPETANATAGGASPEGTGCYYYGPAPDPSNPCRYVGQSAPSGGQSAPTPTANSPPAQP